MKLLSILVLVTVVLIGCGFKGPLYLPKSSDKNNNTQKIESSIIESQNK